jgi:hypothetical protein
MLIPSCLTILLHASVFLRVLCGRPRPRPHSRAATFFTKSGNLALPLVATSCRFCHPERALSPCRSPRTPLNSAITWRALPITKRKAAKTAILS